MKKVLGLIFLTLTLCAASFAQTAQTSTFTYQGRLSDGAAAANGTYDLSFRLFGTATGVGGRVGPIVTRSGVTMSNGIFTVQLDFGGAAAFTGEDRFLEIAVKRSTDQNITILAPRQQITSTPYAIRAISAQAADTATNSNQLGGAAANLFVQTNDGRLSDARAPTAGSANYIHNTTTQQSASNFNVSGDGTAGGTLSGSAVNSATQYNLGGVRILHAPAADTVTLGTSAGSNLNANNPNNTFIGANAGVECRMTSSNGITFGCSNNSFFGRNAGASMISGSRNTFIGNQTNTFNPITGGGGAMRGTNNTLIGVGATLAAEDLDHAVAIGADSYATESNSIVLGRTTRNDFIFAYGPLAAFNSVSLNDSELRLRGKSDLFHTISYNATINGILFTAFDDFSWFNHRNNRINMSLYSNGNLAIVGAYQQLSDGRYKNNVQTIVNPLDTVRRLRGVTYNWNPEFNNNPAKQIGFIAQEVEQVLPELVNTDDKGFKSVAYSNAVPVLVEAVKEQQTQIERQQKQIDELKKIVCAIKPDAQVCQAENK